MISFYGVEFNPKLNKYDWSHFRQLASLTKKSDERLTLYLHDFKQMCWRVLKKKKIKIGEGGVKGGGHATQYYPHYVAKCKVLLKIAHRL